MKTPPYILHREYDQTNARLARTAWEALRAVRRHKGVPIHPAITDVVMPQLGGKVMAEWLKSHYPDLEISFTSGYTEDAIGYNGNESLGSGAAFLSKPYTTPSLLAKYVR